MRKFQPITNYRNPLTGEPDSLRDGLWWYFCMPHGVWFCRDGKVVLFNRARRPLLVHCPKEGLHRPRNKLFDRSWAEWDGAKREDMPDDFNEPPPYDVEKERRFYNKFIGPWLGGRRAAETRVKIMLILCDFMEGKMPERGGKR